MLSKCLIFSAFVLALALVGNFSPDGVEAYGSLAANKSHNLIVGARQAGDHLAYVENIVKNSAWMQIVTAQKTFNVSRYYRITQVRALDLKTNGNGAYASLIKGGPGYNNVTLRFKSQRGHGISFRVEIYGRM